MQISSLNISADLRNRIEAILLNPGPIVSNTYDALTAADSDYATLSGPHKQDLLDSIRAFTTLWFQSLAESRSLRSDEIEVLAAAGRRRVHQGISLASLLKAFRTGTRQILAATLSVARDSEQIRDELLFVVSPYLLEYSDTASQAISQAFLEEQFKGERWRDARRYELSSIIFNSPEDHLGFFKNAESLGLDGHAARVAIALEIETSDIDRCRIEDSLDEVQRTLARLVHAALPELFRSTQLGRQVIWLPSLRGESMLELDARAEGALKSLLRMCPVVRRAGIGLQGRGAPGWAESARQAVRALAIGKSGNNGPSLHSYSQIFLSESARRDAATLQYLDAIIERLGHEQDLVPTLRAYFECSMSRKMASARLEIHPNTLGYRLSRIEELLSLSLSSIGPPRFL
ncbi:helix-turn-helix domain-containing protein [Stenotrophomonas maltophilia]|uniref:PucR family transcriptional regulator n=1 Tax=Stenotrophomonas maltophilia TaxID=40324 RepID=UPI0019D4757F|nr:helix-turn-helix domain-containing protein [Stenotrophomonas maltophilia]MBN7831729.1 helix-turn-helix domain-containing protein [Stenotrophomonas maltophilia]MBN7833561.1 helix-turn-helix domain-containing protein [Stenotrophomonas maltophilia]MBN7859972.1 helix-turn-helix domain-containing protein [Stenotrophomonas maltophilia]MBN7916401.1 helix-turn-helix domain-containing protein [Stenotrophomonas maltophilia]MBO2846688.1 helix-turn-helix domain-containing protein [Stenotrophomonas malt